MKFIKATCPSCGASLELADHLQSATCPNCGSKISLEIQTTTSAKLSIQEETERLGKILLENLKANVRREQEERNGNA